MPYIRVYLISALILIVALSAACSAGGRRGAGQKPGLALIPFQSGDPFGELSKLEPPAGADPAVFELLRGELEKALKGAGKLRASSAAPTLTESKVMDLAYLDDGDGTYSLAWTYRNKGDYDQNGEVGVSDITPIALNFLESASDEGPQDPDMVVDGDGNGEIGVSDITPIAINYLITVAKYKVEGSANANGPFQAAGEIALPNATPGGWFTPISFDLGATPAFEYYRVVPDDGNGHRGIPSNVASKPALNLPPDITSVSPLFAQTGSNVTFVAEVTGDAPLVYAWDFAGGATPGTSSEVSPTVTIGDVGTYSCTLTVTNDFGEDVFPFTLQATLGAPPNISGVSPLSCQTDVDVTFTATVTGEAPLSYEWDFGGGTTPGTSTEASPTVHSGAVGTYDCTLTVTNSIGSDSFPFTLEITELPPPPVILDVQPREGNEGEVVTFVATVEGTGPFTYLWDFRPACVPGLSTAASPDITLQTPGTWPVTLEVSNAGGSDAFGFQLTIVDTTIPPSIQSVAPTSGEEGTNITIAATINGPGPFTYNWNFGGGAAPNSSTEESPTITLGAPGEYNASLFVTNAFGNDSYPFTLTVTAIGQNWTTYTVDNFGMSEHPSLAIIGGNPCIAYYDGQNEDLVFASCNAADGSGTWTSYPVDQLANPGDEVGRHCSLVSIGGLPGISYHIGGADSDLKYATCDAADGSGTWSKYTIDSDGKTGMYTCAAEVGGRPAISYVNAQTGDLKYAISDTADPSGSWTNVIVDSGDVGAWNTVLLLSGGVPVIGYYTNDGGGEYKTATADTADGTGSWTIRSVQSVGGGFIGSGRHMAAVNSTIASAFFNFNDTRLRFAINGAADASGSWTFRDVDALGNSRQHVSLAAVGGLPSLGFFDVTSLGLWAAWCDAADGSGTWTVEPVKAGINVNYTSVAEVDGRIGIAYYDVSAGQLKLAVRNP
ncbi:MAG: PKD domain-containing protein [bacterium]|jgi:PKD repeat protein